MWTPDYFECLEAIDALEFLVLDRLNPDGEDSTLEAVRAEAIVVHDRLTAIAQSKIDTLVQAIRAHRLSARALRQRFRHYAHVLPGNSRDAEPYYDRFDDFLSQLLWIEVEPSETRPRAPEMVYFQPTPGRIVLDMLAALPFTADDRFYDLGAGLGRVLILVALLSPTPAVGIEYEPTYVRYARASARKLGVDAVEIRNQDAREADLSDGTIFFMYTPFTGVMLRQVIDRLRTLAGTHPITVCSYGPCTPTLAREPWLSPVRYAADEIYRLAIFRSGTPDRGHQAGADPNG